MITAIMKYLPKSKQQLLLFIFLARQCMYMCSYTKADKMILGLVLKKPYTDRAV